MNDKKIDEYVKNCERTGENLRGYEPFAYLYDNGTIKEGTVINIPQSEHAEAGDYRVNSIGTLEIMTTGEPPYRPEWLLSEEISSEGWTYSLKD